ncbi:S-adenosylmethionine carrier 1, chloroplastic/mitochondrial [Ancistrocladus abbreviatus]
MGPFTLAVDGKSSSSMAVSSNGSTRKLQNKQFGVRNFFASVNVREEKPFDFFQTLLDGIIAGGTAGLVVETVLYPIDTIKTRLQASHGGGKIALKGLYSGLAGNLAGVFPASATFVGVYEPSKQKLLKLFPENLSAIAHLHSKCGWDSAWDSMFCPNDNQAQSAGAIGGIAASLIRVPTEVVKQRMQTGQFASAPDAVRLIVSREGFKGLYAVKRDLNDPENAVIGAFAGALTGAITTPLDVIKTRLMVQGSASQYKGILDCITTIVQEEGPPALLKGIGPRVLWIGIGGSIFFSVLERTKRVLAQRHSKQGQHAQRKQN